MYDPVLLQMVSYQIVAERIAGAERQRMANALSSTSSASRQHLLFLRTLRIFASRLRNSLAFRPGPRPGGALSWNTLGMSTRSSSTNHVSGNS
jgi:hypothetical protein